MPTELSEKPSDSRDRTERRRRRLWVPRIAALACYLIGFMNVVGTLFVRVRPRLHDISAYVPGVVPAATAGTLVAGVLLLLLARGLRRRKQRAWRAVTILLSVTIALHVIRGKLGFGHGMITALTCCLALTVLIRYRDDFYALGDPRTRWRALWVFLLLTATGVLLGGLIVNTGHPLGSPGMAERFEHVLFGLVGFDGPLHFPTPKAADFVGFCLFGLGTVTAVTTAYLALRPAAPVPYLSGSDVSRMRDLLGQHGDRDSLGYFALRHDKSVIWSPTGKACVPYRVVSGVMLASGDPLGDYEAWPLAMHRFMAEADRYAWVPAVLGCSQLGAEVWTRETGLAALELGDEAVVNTETFSLKGRVMRNVRQMVNRIERQGYSCDMRRVGDIPADELAELSRLAESWRDGRTERGYSMALGRMGGVADSACVVVTARKDGRIRALLQFAPWGEDGISLDLMRRDRTAEPGLNELMIVHSLRTAGELGIRRASLNFAMFRSHLERGERLGAWPMLRAWRNTLVFLSRWFQIESLYKFNAKFQPEWEPRYIIYPSVGDLPRTLLAIGEAEAFVVLPRLSRRAAPTTAAGSAAASAEPGDGPAEQPEPDGRQGAGSVPAG